MLTLATLRKPNALLAVPASALPLRIIDRALLKESGLLLSCLREEGWLGGGTNVARCAGSDDGYGTTDGCLGSIIYGGDRSSGVAFDGISL